MARRVLWSLALIAALVTPIRARAQGLAVDFTSITTVAPSVDATYGWAFTALANSSITALGVFDALQDGLQSSHAVGLWDSSGTLLGSATVAAGTGNTLMGFFRIASIAPVTLIAGTNYVVGAFYGINDGDLLGSGSATGLTFDPAIGYTVNAAGVGTSLMFPNLRNIPAGQPGASIYGGNMVVSVPEPGSLILLLTGLVLIAMIGLRDRREGFLTDH